jgi:hypothetical protein
VEIVEVRAQDVRLPAEAARALDDHKAVAVTRYGKRLHVVLAEEQFALVEPLLELLADGADVSPELLRSTADLELERELAEDRDTPAAENEQIAELLDRRRR